MELIEENEKMQENGKSITILTKQYKLENTFPLSIFLPKILATKNILRNVNGLENFLKAQRFVDQKIV